MLKAGINVTVLPQTHQDAVEATYRLGYKYLWIDSLCILQDSAEDWQAESAVMGEIYQNSVCTIAATGSSDSSGGLFVSRNSMFFQSVAVVQHKNSPDKNVHVHPAGKIIVPLVNFRTFVMGTPDKPYNKDVLEFQKDVEDSMLAKRSWIVQERLLSPRILHFGARQLLWECRTCNRSEAWPKMISIPQTMKLDKDFISAVSTLRSADGAAFNKLGHQSFMHLGGLDQALFDAVIKFNQTWISIVKTYTTANLTYEKDKLIALSGVAKMLQNISGKKYLAGLWEPFLTSGLLWYVWEGRRDTRPPEYRAPSWSWASIDGVVDNFFPYCNPRKTKIQILNAELINVNPEPASTITMVMQHGRLTIKGKVGTANVSRPYINNGAEDNVFGESIIRNLSDARPYHLVEQGGRSSIGLFYPDTKQDVVENITFLVIVVDGPLTAKELLEVRTGRTLYNESPLIRGLALVPSGSVEDEYRRVGYIEFMHHVGGALWEPTKSVVKNCKKQIITII
jgi:hypothetical protein